ncbi:tetratricopeptide repeat protein [Acrocarpospora catenulata]|uniref:tetratricopeptide repeat protein n=1 Tax=Acrocarpospora catenulata TaxID=2836182 RepID=UPI001BD91D9D|nr:helix-turn-helix transcriptional regulator [Acrocarpospora catenulata]
MSRAVRLTGVTLAVLDVLSEGEAVYGFQIAGTIKRPTGTVYPLLSRLERLGWLDARWESEQPAEARGRGPRRRYYRLNALGWEQSIKALRERDQVREAASGGGRPTPGTAITRDQVLIDFAAMLRSLRDSAAQPSLWDIAAQAACSVSAVAAAFSGHALPSAALVTTIAMACGADPGEWRRRRSFAEQSIRHGIWISDSYEEFHPLGADWVRESLRRRELDPEDEADLVQDVLADAFEQWHDLSVVSDLRGWLLAHTARLARRRPQDPPFLMGLTPPAGSVPAAPDVADTIVEEAQAHELLRRLDRGSAKVVYLRSLGHSGKEVAELLRVSRWTVEAAITRARRNVGVTPVHHGRRYFIRYLAAIRRSAGNPSVRAIAEKISFSHAHVASVLSGAELPSWTFTVRLVQALEGSPDLAWQLWREAKLPLLPVPEAWIAENWVKEAARTADALALSRLFHQLKKEGFHQQASEVWRTAAELGNPVGMIGFAESCERNGDIAEAKWWLRRALQLGAPTARRKLVGVLERTGQLDDAIRLARQDTGPGAEHELSRLLERAGRVDEALELWRRDTSPAGQYRLAQLLERAGRLDEAIEVRQRESRVGGQKELAQLLERAGRVAEAIDLLRQAARDNVTAMRALSELLERHGRLDEARQIWRDAAADGNSWATRQMATQLMRTRMARMRWDLVKAVKAGDIKRVRDTTALFRTWDSLVDAFQILCDLARTGSVVAVEELAHLLGQQDRKTIKDWVLTVGRDSFPLLDEYLDEYLDDSVLEVHTETLLSRAADNGHWGAQIALAELHKNDRRLVESSRTVQKRPDLPGVAAVEALARQDKESELRAWAEAGYYPAQWRLAERLIDRGEHDGAIALLREPVRNGNSDAAWRLAQLLATLGRVDELRTLADDGSDYAGWLLSGQLARSGDWAGLRALAESSKPYAAHAAERLAAHRRDH